MTDLARRTHQTILLLQTLLDVQPAPTTWTGNLVQRNALPGPSPSRWQRCETCDATGHTLDKFQRPSQCPMCAGHGRYKIDDYTQQRVSTMEHGLITRTTTVKCDSCEGDGAYGNGRRCPHCDGTGRRTVTPRALGTTHEQTRKPSEDVLWGKGGSYHELERALHNLDTIDHNAHHQLWDVHVLHILDETDAKQPLLELSVKFLVTRMPNPILVPAGVNAAQKRARAHRLKTHGRHIDPRARAARDSEIRKLHRHGKPIQWIAQHTGLSISSVYDILAKHQPVAA